MKGLKQFIIETEKRRNGVSTFPREYNVKNKKTIRITGDKRKWR